MIKLINKYKELSAPVKASVWFAICGFFQNGISMLITPIFTRVMLEAEYGRYSVYISWYNIISLIATLNLAAGVYTRGLIKNEDDQDAFSSSLLGLSTTSILVFTVIYFIFHHAVNDIVGLNTYLMISMFAEMWAISAYQFWSNRERVAYRYKKLVILTVAFVVLRPLISLIAILNVDTAHQVEARATAVILVNFTLFAGLYISIFKKGKKYFTGKYWIYALKFNLPLIPHYLSQIILNQSDRIMIGKYCTNAEVGYYSVAYTLASAMTIFNSAISSTMNPWIYRNIKSKNYSAIGRISNYILLLIAGMNLVIIFMAPEVLSILAPKRYRSALWVIPPVSAGVYFTFLYNLFATFEYYFEKTWWTTIGTVICAGANVILNAIFIPLFGFVAAGYTTLICYILYAFAHYCFMRKINKQFMDGYKVYNPKIILSIGAGLIICAGIMMLLYDYILIRYLMLLFTAVIVWIKRNSIISLFKSLKK